MARSLLNWIRKPKVKSVPAKDQSEYHIGSPHADEHAFEAVVIRPMHQGVIDQLNVLKTNFGINLYDLVSVEGGAMRIARHGVDDISIEAVKIAYELHHVKTVIMIGLQCAPKHGISHSFCQDYPDMESNIELMLEAQHILSTQMAELGMQMNYYSYLLVLSEDGQKLNFFHVDRDEEGIKKSLVYALPYRGKKESDSVVVWCMDARFRQATKTYVRAVLGLDHYGLVSIPGGAKGIVEEGEKSAAMDCIRSSITYHGARHVHLISHMDCGAYGGSGAFCGADDEIFKLSKDLETAAEFIVNQFPKVQVHIHLQRAQDEKIYFRSMKTFLT